MLYAIICTDNPDSQALRAAARQAHRERLQQLSDLGKLVLAGPFPAVDSSDPGPAGFTGSLIVAEFADIATAEAWANEDPYLLNGTYSDVQIKPFHQVF